ncbi:hypothetical protein MITS9504_00545 [Synechococcus sp. MIT S9504]|nr:hypothetical protein MITS9504_00545 [Synechococcus sp. MIT S9504]
MGFNKFLSFIKIVVSTKYKEVFRVMIKIAQQTFKRINGKSDAFNLIVSFNLVKLCP